MCFYQTLGTTKYTTSAEIGQAYVKAAHACHTEEKQSEDASLLLRAGKDAQDVLYDQKKRQRYDFELSVGVNYNKTGSHRDKSPSTINVTIGREPSGTKPIEWSTSLVHPAHILAWSWIRRTQSVLLSHSVV